MTIETHLRVLLVEDNPLDARSVVRALGLSTDAEYEVVHVGDFQSAMKRASDEAFDCILLDLSLPDSEGLVPVEALGLRASPCPVVVLTGLDDPAVAVEAVQRGAQDYLTKSTITPELIERAIRYAVARHHSEIQLQSAQDLLDTIHDRERIARDLHDTVIQRLFAAGMRLQAAASSDDLGDIRQRARAAVDEIDEAIQELREAIFGLKTVSEEVSLASDIARMVDAEEELLGFRPDVRISAIDSLDGELHHAVVSVVREALANIARHAGATAVEVAVLVDDGRLDVRVTDNGSGIGPLRGREPAPGRSGHGLRNLRSRAIELGGHLTVGPGPAGGCRVEWSVPLAPD